MSQPLTITNPELIPLWDTELNATGMHTVSKGSTKKAWWKCEQGHQWEANISSIVRGTRCPYCSGRKAIPGVNDIATLYPNLVLDWHPDNTVNLNQLRPGSHEKLKWTCTQGHTWTAKARDRVNGSGCHVCKGKAVQQGYNDLSTTHPQVALLWDYNNNSILPTEISAGSEKKISFLCTKGHQWVRSLRQQAETASGCSYCAGRKAVTGENDLATTHPEIASQWHPELNADLTPTMVTAGMDKKVWWKADCGHEWDSYLHARTKQKQGCPYCSGTRVLAGYNDLATLKPELAAQWHPELNLGKTASMVTYASSQKVWWKCDKNHEWQAKITGRSISNVGCPYCAAGKSISRGEKEICDFIMSHGFTVEQSNRLILNGMEIDILIEGTNIAIEYNGLYWHGENQGKDSTYHYTKWLKAKEAGLILIQVWEDEWKSDKEHVKNFLLHSLGISNMPKIDSTDAIVRETTVEEALNFLAKNHTAGPAIGSHYYGLFQDTVLHAIIVISQETRESFNIIQYATDTLVIGGFAKMIACIEESLQPSFLTIYSDNCVSDGSLYANAGFTVESEIAPDYRYIIGTKRCDKFDFGIQKFRDDPSLLWKEGMTEEELARLNGIDRIWDAGKTKWVKQCIKHV